jgi:hypothetical protein
MVRAHLGHLEKRRHQAIGYAAVVHAFTHCVDARIISLHGVVGHDAAVAMNSGTHRERNVGPDADRHHNQLRINLRTVIEAHCLHVSACAVFSVTDNPFSISAEQKFQPSLLQGLLQQFSGGGVELLFHQPVRQMYNGDIHAAQLQAVRRFQPQQAPADHHRTLILCCGRNHCIGVGYVPIGNYPGQPVARHGQHEGSGTGGQQQAVIFRCGAVLGRHHAARAVDLRNLFAQMQLDPAAFVPLDIIQHDVLYGLLAGQHRRQEDAVVIGKRFRSEHGDFVNVRRNPEQFFQRAHARHAIADHNQLQLLH